MAADRPRRPRRPQLHAVPMGAPAGAGVDDDDELHRRSAELADLTFRLLDKDLAGSSPLEAELWVAALVSTWAEQVLDDGSDPVVVLGRVHLDRALEVPTPAARVLVGALPAVVGDAEVAALAEQVARDLDRQGVRLPRWARGLGERRFKRAAIMDHELDDGERNERVDAAVDGFVDSLESIAVIDRYGVEDVEHVARHLAEYAAQSGGDPLRISPSSVQVALWSYLPDEGCFGEDDAAWCST